jgi:hypothetical protein
MPEGGIEDTSLQVIVGEQLSAVTFVQDYVQLHFDGPCLTAFAPPVVMLGEQTFHWGEPCFRDALCERIAQKVTAARVVSGADVSIRFEDGSIIQISLQHADAVCGEAVKFDASDTAWWML